MEARDANGGVVGHVVP